MKHFPILLLLAVFPALSLHAPLKRSPTYQATVYNGFSATGLTITLSFYDGSTNTLWGQESATLSPGQSYLSNPYLASGTPYIRIQYSFAHFGGALALQTINPDGAYPGGVPCRSLLKGFGSFTYDADPNTQGYGMWNFNFSDTCP